MEKTHCRHGHSYKEHPPYMRANGQIARCRKCHLDRHRTLSRPIKKRPKPMRVPKSRDPGLRIPTNEILALGRRIEISSGWQKEELRAELAALLESTKQAQKEGAGA